MIFTAESHIHSWVQYLLLQSVVYIVLFYITLHKVESNCEQHYILSTVSVARANFIQNWSAAAGAAEDILSQQPQA